MTSRIQQNTSVDNFKHKAPLALHAAWLDCHLKQKELGHRAMDNPIYQFAIYSIFLWLLGPLSHRFVDCLLSWVLMSSSLNHCIITALIHFLACPHSHAVCWLTTIRKKKNGTEHSAQSRQLVTSSLKVGGILQTLPFYKRHSSRAVLDCSYILAFQVTSSPLPHYLLHKHE